MVGQPMTLPARDVCLRISRLLAMMGSPADNEAETARKMLLKILDGHGCSWNDLPDILAATETDAADEATSPSDVDESVETEAAAMHARGDNLFDMLLAMFDQYVWLRDRNERVAVVLCLLNAWVFDNFEHCPRLMILAPRGGCGKSRLLRGYLKPLLPPEAFFSANATPASIYDFLEDCPGCPLLLDEVDTLKIDGALLSLFNAGHEYDGTITRHKKMYKVFAPLFMAGIDTTLPRSLMHRAVSIRIQKPPEGVRIAPLSRRKPPRKFAVVRAMLRKFAATCRLNTQPEMPFELHDARHADNWRPLISVADALGRGELARAAAVALTSQRANEDPTVKLLTDIQRVFDNPPSSRYGCNRIPADDLTEALCGLDDGYWAEWRGRDGKREPRKLKRSELVVMLRDLYPPIQTRTIWPLGPRNGTKSDRGYERHQFAEAWATYCSKGEAKSRSNTRLLAK
jgi:hypothetical protein